MTTALVIPSADQAIGAHLPTSLVKREKPNDRQQLNADEYLKKLCNDADKESQELAWVRAERWNRNYYFFLGGLANSYGFNVKGVWNHLSNLRGLYTSNNFAEKEMTLMSVLVRSNPSYKVTPTSGSGETKQREDQEMESGMETEDAKRNGALIAQRITDHDSRIKCPASFLLRKWFYRLNFGTSFSYINFDKNCGPKSQVPQTSPTQINEPGMNFCGGCGMTTQAQGPSGCASCGAPPDMVEHFPGQSIDDNVLGNQFESVSVGDTRLWGPSPWEIGLPPNAKLNIDNGEMQTDFVSWYQLSRKKRIAYTFEIDDDFSDDLQVPFMVRQQERLERQYVGSGNLSSKDFAVTRRYWFREYMYYDWKVPQDITLADGTEIARGSRAFDYCPEGMYIARVGNRILDLQKTNIDDHWGMAHYIYNPMSPWGKGVEDGADLQVIINALYQIAVEHAKRDAVGTTFINQNAGLSPKALRGGNVVPTDLPLGTNMNTAAMRLDGNALSPSLFKTLDQARNDQTAVTGASSVLAGTNETLPDTLGATQLLVQRATSVLTPMFMMDTEQGCRIWGQNLKLRQRFQSADAFMPFTDENEHEQGRAFSGSDIPMDFVVSVVDHSWMPTDSLDIRAELEQALKLGDIPMGIWAPGFPEDVKQVALSVMTTLPRSLNKNQKDEDNAHARLLALKKAVAMVRKMNLPPEAMPTAMQQILTMPSVKVRPQVDNIPVFVEVSQLYAKSLLNDPPAEIDFMLVTAVEQYIEALKEGSVEQNQETSAAGVAGQLPQAIAANTMEAASAANQQPPAPEPPPQVDPTQVMEQEHEGRTKAAELADNQAEREHQMEMADKQEKESEKDRKHAMAIAKLKPKPTAPPKAKG